MPIAVALSLRLAVAMPMQLSPSWDGAIYARAAEQLARGEGYTLRILGADKTTPTAFYPVGFPAALALVRVLGGGLTADRALQSVIGTGIVPLAYVFARRASGRRAGTFAAWTAALWPGAILLSASWLAEPLFALASGLALLPLVHARRRNRARATAVTALSLGAVAYIRATAVPIAACVGALSALYLWPGRSLLRRMIAAAAAATICAGLACVPLAPWTARNFSVLGAPVLVSTNGGLNLFLGAIDDGGFRPRTDDDPCGGEHLHELARDRCYRDHAIREIGRAPLTWLGRGVLKLSHTFGHESAPAQCFVAGLRLPAPDKTLLGTWALGLCRLGWLVVLAGAAAGALRAMHAAPRIMRVVLFAPVLGLVVLHFVYIGGDRYHTALMPVLSALAGVGFAAYRRSAAPPASRRETRADTGARSTCVTEPGTRD